MNSLLYGIGWLLVFGVTTPAHDVTRSRIDQDKLPPRLRGENGKQLALFAGAIAVLSAASLLVWGAHHVQWYVLILGLLIGIVLAGFVRQLVSVLVLLTVVPVFLVLLNVTIWYWR
jgi:hypothetical protein